MKKILIASLVLVGLNFVNFTSAAGNWEPISTKYNCNNPGWDYTFKSNGGSVKVVIGGETIMESSISDGKQTVHFLMPKGQKIAEVIVTTGEQSYSYQMNSSHADCTNPNSGGGLSNPCQLLGTCPNFGDMEWENGHKPYPKGGVEALKLAQTRLLMMQLIDSLSQLLAKLVALKELEGR